MNYNRSFSDQHEADISEQFQGVEIEFNDKVTLFPVQVERADSTLKARGSRTRAAKEQGDWQ